MGTERKDSGEQRLRAMELDLQQKDAEIAMLREITEVIASEYSLEKVFELVASRAHDLIQAQTLVIPVLSADQSTYTYRAAIGASADELLDATLPIDTGICGWVLRHRKAWWRGIPDQLNDNERNQWEQRAGAIILVPLIGRHQFLGGIAGINKAGGGDFDERDLELLTMFASQVSIVIENAMFFEELDVSKQCAEAYREKLQDSNKRLSRSNEDLQHLAVHDPLTGLPNRTLVLDRIEQGILNAKRNHNTMALIMIDLDHFKEVNDTLGHPVGDGLLVNVGQCFQTVLRKPDTLGRLGGDEFAVVLPQADRDAALIVAGKLHAVLQQPVQVDESSFSIGASMGIALYPDHGADPSALLKCADVAMYVAKRHNDEYSVYDPVHDDYNPNRLELLRDLRTAIQRREIGIAFQPKLDLNSGVITGVEVLARWSHPERGIIPPYDFIPVLEQTGLIKPFTLQVIEKSVRYCKEYRDQGYELGVAVNLSMHNLRDEKLPRQIAEILGRFHLGEHCLTLEITESAIMHDPECSLDILTKLNKMGVGLSVDDFGTGYSSLSYLKRLPVQQLKIDRAFVSDMIDDTDDAMIVRSTVDLAHNLGLNTVAEGVENEATLKTLETMGCDLAQGYLISRPLSHDDFLSYLRAGEWSVHSHQ